jgi:PPOX class probable F420-dependent enzyme
MIEKIPESHADLVTKEKKAIAFLALVKSNGDPQVTPVWFDYDGTHFIINTARGRVKDRILHHHPHVAFAIADPADVGRYLQVSGRVVDESEEGAYEQICELSLKYTGKRSYSLPAGQVRVTYKVLPERYNSNK